jgi:hypothetical protein
MSTGAIITMIVVQVSVTIVTAYFFIKVLKTPEKNKHPAGMKEGD